MELISDNQTTASGYLAVVCIAVSVILYLAWSMVSELGLYLSFAHATTRELANVLDEQRRANSTKGT